MRKSKLFTLSIVAASLLTIIGCTKSEPTSSESAKARNIRLAYIMAPGGPSDEGAKKFKEIVEQKTNGKLTVSLYPSAQLGAERDVLEGLKIGSIDMTLTGDGAIGIYAPQYNALQVPFAIRNIDHLHKIFDGQIGKDLSSDLQKAVSATVLDYWDRGPRQLTAKKQISKPEDLKGVKMRVPEVPLYVEAWKAIGSSPTPIVLSELYTALQQGVVEAQENPLEVIATSHFNEVQSYIMKTDHIFGPYILWISDKILKDLPADQQKIIKDAAKEAGTFEKKLTADLEVKWEKELKDKGMKIVDVDKKLFEEKAKTLVEKFNKDWKPGLYEQIINTK